MVSRVNEPAQVGPYYARPRPIDSHQRQAGSGAPNLATDLLAIHIGEGIQTRPILPPTLAPSRAYLVVVGLVALFVTSGIWWGGTEVLIGVCLGGLAAALLWIVRKDVVSEFQDLFW